MSTRLSCRFPRMMILAALLVVAAEARGTCCLPLGCMEITAEECLALGGTFLDESLGGCADNDRDGDGVRDECDPCPDDPGKLMPGVCGCGEPDVITGLEFERRIQTFDDFGRASQPRDVAVNAAGRVVVVDDWKDRVVVFDRTDPPFELPDLGLSPPRAAAVDAVGRVYVLTSHDGVHIHDVNGTPIHSFGASGSAPGELFLPRDIEISRDGDIIIADSSNHRVQVFDAAGNFIRAWGRDGDRPGEFELLQGLGIDPRGDVYTADLSNHRIDVFTIEGDYLRSIPASSPRDVSFDPAGNMYTVTARGAMSFDATGELRWRRTGPSCIPGAVQAPSSIAAGQDGCVYMSDFHDHRVKVLTVEGDPQSPLRLPEPRIGTLKSVYDIAIDATGRLVVADADAGEVVILGPRGDLQMKITCADVEVGGSEYFWPIAVDVDASGRIYIGDATGWVHVLSPDGVLLHRIGSRGLGEGQFRVPNSVAIGPTGRIHVLDGALSGKILVYDADGRWLFSITETGPQPGGLFFPTGIDVDDDGRIYLRDAARVQVFSPSGEYEREFSVLPPGAAFVGNHGLTLDHAGNVYVPDMEGNELLVFDNAGALLARYSYPLFLQWHGAGLAADPAGQVYFLGQDFQFIHATVEVLRPVMRCGDGFQIDDVLELITAPDLDPSALVDLLNR